MKTEDINRIVGITESYQLPDMMMQRLFENPTDMFDEFMKLGEPLDHDWFTGYFEEEHANKSKMMQDFTPAEVCDLLAHVVGKAESVADVCAGTGGLTIGMWRDNPAAEYACFEYSSRAIPLLLFNLAIRNIKAYICRCDLLTGEEFEYFRINEGGRYGRVERVETPEREQYDACVSNPPYSQKYDLKKDDRFPEYDGMLPSNFADYVFVAFALKILKDGGRAGFILPHGVLFRGNKEALFRRTLIENGTLKSVIGLPNKLFINTDIPTCIIELRKDGRRDGILFIDANDEADKEGKKNILRQRHITRIMKAFDARRDEERFAHIASMEELEENKFNCNIPRYVDSYIPEPIPDFVEIMSELSAAEKEAERTKLDLLRMVGQLYGTTPQAEEEFRKGISAYKRTITRTAREYEQAVLKFDS